MQGTARETASRPAHRFRQCLSRSGAGKFWDQCPLCGADGLWIGHGDFPEGCRRTAWAGQHGQAH